MLSQNLLRRLSALAMCLALAGCCANDICNCQDELADALFFRVNYTKHRQYARDSNGRLVPITFNASDVDTIRIYRRNILPLSLRGKGADTLGFVRQTDSVTIARRLDTTSSPGDTLIATQIQSTSTNGITTTLKEQDIIVINNASPFSSSGSSKLNAYTYRIGILRSRSGRRKPSPIYYITGIDLKGNYNANGCCTCYRNTTKTDTLTIGVTATTAKRVLPINAATDSPDTLNGRRIVRLPFPY